MEERQFINKIYLRSLIPTALSVLLVQLCSVINNMAVGSFVGSDGLAIMSVVSPIGFIFATIGSLVAVGGSIQAAHSLGEHNYEASNKCLFLSLKIMAICSIILTSAIMIFSNPILSVLGAPESIRAEANKYVLAFAPASFAAMGVYIPFNYLKINGAQKYAVYVSAVMLAVNIGLDFVFAKVLGLGMLGIGLATTIAYWTSTVPGIIILYSKKGGFQKPSKNKKKGLVKKIIYSGSPSAVNNLCHFLRSLLMNLIIVSALGKDGLSTLSIISTTFLLSVTVSNGTSLSMASFSAVFSSEKDNTSLRQVFTVALISAIVLMSGFVAIVAFFPAQVCSLFSVTDNFATENALRIFAISLIFNGINTVFTTFYQSIKRAVCSNVFTVLRSFAGVVAFAFIISKFGNPSNIWYAFLCAEIVSLASTLIYAFIYGCTHKNISKILMIDTAPEKNGKYLAFSVGNDNAQISESAEKITEFCEQNELNHKLTMAMGLAVEEILVSFNEHALKDEKTNLRSNVRIILYNDIVILRFRTAGKPFDPIDYADNDTEFGSDSMGIKMIQKLSEVTLFNRVFGLNNLTIIFEGGN